MLQSPKSELELRVACLERRLQWLQTALIAAILTIVAAVSYLSLHSYFSAAYSRGVLRVKGLIVEDDAGRERVLIGAPVPGVRGRKRQDNTVGIVVIGNDGSDRLALGAPVPEPQIEGVIGKRVGQESGLIIDDNNGDERGGLAFSTMTGA